MSWRLRTVPHLLARSQLARRYAIAHDIPGLVFNGYGRAVGLRLLIARQPLGWAYLINPVSIVRYWEFEFVAAELPNGINRAADISSPRLFSFWYASRHPDLCIDLLNPDPDDSTASSVMASTLKQPRVVPATKRIDELPMDVSYDAIWSISVVEHISGAYDDTAAVRMMYDALRLGGHLILTVPVDRSHRDEFRSSDPYGTQEESEGKGFFFQRFYDERTMFERLVRPLPAHDLVSIRWFGERRQGHFSSYESDWIERGLARTVEDPREIADHYREYQSWSEMPGMGVCGIHVVRAS
ncbi:MAG TPA: hypothetical protein VM848_00160 [Acidimicrobiia bacterium]|nr:hypothetical protein [Acidimicrobiia bacterium]